MATAAIIPVSEYLTTFYKPDCDYVDGELQERCLGERDHGVVQSFLTSVFRMSRSTWQVWSITEQRIQTSPTRFRVADVCVGRLSALPDSVIRKPPLLCIEILSPGQSLGRVQTVVDDYTEMGVEHIWLIDPKLRRAWTADASGLHAVPDVMAIAGTEIAIALADIWAELDELAATGQ